MSTIVSTLESLLAADQVVSGEQITETLKYPFRSTTVDGALPQAVVYPQNEGELCEVMACACAHRWRVLPFGSGSKLSWGGLAQGFDLAISTQHLNQLIDHAVGDMTLTAAAGLKFADLKPQLAHQQQCLAIDPAYPDRATLGGIVSTADTGSLRQRYNSVRDMLIGISLVRYDGKLAKAGGRVVKNVAGYDLMKLMTGAYGSLGIISQVTFRLYPIPDASKTIIVAGAANDIEKFAADLRQSSLTPIALDILSPSLATNLGFDKAFTLAACFQSNLPGVEEQVTLVSKLAPQSLSPQVLEGDAEASLWDKRWLNRAATDESWGDDAVVLAKVGVLPGKAVGLLAKVHDQFSEAAWGQIHAGSGIGTLMIPATIATTANLQALRVLCESFGGYLTVLQAPKSLKTTWDVWGYSGNALPIMQQIKATFDPHSLLNAGRFIGGL
jgi:glycolate oxidase FAD binding subunit